MNGKKQNLPEKSVMDLFDKSNKPQLFYARRMTMMGILLSATALIVLTWTVVSGGAISTGMVLGYVFFTLILLVNVTVHFRPYVQIGSDYVQVYGQRACFNQIVKYEDFSKGFIINFNALPGEIKYDYDKRLLVTYNRIKDYDKPKLIYALNEAMLKVGVKKEK